MTTADKVISCKRQLDAAVADFDTAVDTAGSVPVVNKICNPYNYNRMHEFEIAWRLGVAVGKVGGGDDLEGGGEVKSCEYNGLNKLGALKQHCWMFNGRPVFDTWRKQAADIRGYFRHIGTFYPCIRLASGESILFITQVDERLVKLAVERGHEHYRGLAQKKDQRMSIRITSTDLLKMGMLNFPGADREQEKNLARAQQFLGTTFFDIHGRHVYA
jgi:hypothetical protein